MYNINNMPYEIIKKYNYLSYMLFTHVYFDRLRKKDSLLADELQLALCDRDKITVQASKENINHVIEIFFCYPNISYVTKSLFVDENKSKKTAKEIMLNMILKERYKEELNEADDKIFLYNKFLHFIEFVSYQSGINKEINYYALDKIFYDVRNVLADLVHNAYENKYSHKYLKNLLKSFVLEGKDNSILSEEARLFMAGDYDGKVRKSKQGRSIIHETTSMNCPISSFIEHDLVYALWALEVLYKINPTKWEPSSPAKCGIDYIYDKVGTTFNKLMNIRNKPEYSYLRDDRLMRHLVFEVAKMRDIDEVVSYFFNEYALYLEEPPH